MDKVNKELIEDNLNLSKENAKQKEMIERQWKLLEQCGVSAGGELKRVSYLLENLRKENKILLGQLVINDGEDVTVQISKSQFDEYNKFRQTLQEIKAIAEMAINGGYVTKSSDYSEGMEIIGHYVMQKITKTEEE